MEELRDHPNMLAYETYNEPAWRPDTPTEVSMTPAEMAAGYEALRSADPHHPVHLVRRPQQRLFLARLRFHSGFLLQGHSASATVEALQEYNAACDLVGCNPYPVLPAQMRRHIGLRPSDGRALDSPDQSIGAICDYTAKMVEVGSPDKLPCWMQLQAMAWEDFRAPGLERGTRIHTAVPSTDWPRGQSTRQLSCFVVEHPRSAAVALPLVG